MLAIARFLSSPAFRLATEVAVAVLPAELSQLRQPRVVGQVIQHLKVPGLVLVRKRNGGAVSRQADQFQPARPRRDAPWTGAQR